MPDLPHVNWGNLAAQLRPVPQPAPAPFPEPAPEQDDEWHDPRAEANAILDRINRLELQQIGDHDHGQALAQEIAELRIKFNQVLKIDPYKEEAMPKEAIVAEEYIDANEPDKVKFNLPYDDTAELMHRLGETAICHRGVYYLVEAVEAIRKGFSLYLRDGRNRKIIKFRGMHDAPDFRAAPAQYVVYQGQVCYVQRRPFRQYKQGITYKSCSAQALVVRPMQVGYRVHLRSTKDLISSLNKTKPGDYENCRIYSKSLASVILESNEYVNYKGRYLGTAKAKVVTLATRADYVPWVLSALEEVGLSCAI